MSGYTREQFATAVDAAHDALHGVTMADMSSAAAWLKIAAAHDALHAVGAGTERTGCATPDPEAQRLASDWLEKLNSTGLPCGHRLADLVGSKDEVTKCGACLAERQRVRGGVAVPHAIPRPAPRPARGEGSGPGGCANVFTSTCPAGDDEDPT